MHVVDGHVAAVAPVVVAHVTARCLSCVTSRCTGLLLPKLVDVEWKLDYIARSSSAELTHQPQYLVRLTTAASGEATHPHPLPTRHPMLPCSFVAAVLQRPLPLCPLDKGREGDCLSLRSLLPQHVATRVYAPASIPPPIHTHIHVYHSLL